MRTKTLLLTAALGAAGIATSMAQVYSQNAVGYINLTLPAGFSLIANQLVAPSYALSALLPAPPLGTQIFKLTPGGTYSLSTFDEGGDGWLPNGNATIDLGKGVWINTPTAFTLTFVGEVPQGTLTTATPTGFNIVSSQVPQAGLVQTALGLVPNLGEQIFKHNGPGASPAYTLYTFDEGGDGWLPTQPSFNVGQAFWLLRGAGPNTSWTRTFSVN